MFVQQYYRGRVECKVVGHEAQHAVLLGTVISDKAQLPGEAPARPSAGKAYGEVREDVPAVGGECLLNLVEHAALEPCYRCISRLDGRIHLWAGNQSVG